MEGGASNALGCAEEESCFHFRQFVEPYTVDRKVLLEYHLVLELLQ